MKWHRALGHVNFNDLFRLSEQLSLKKVSTELECETCLLGKSVRLPFDKCAKDRTKSPLELIHSDLSGTIRTPNQHHFAYFLTFTDDYSRYTQLYLLRSKEEVFERFKEFKNVVENKFNAKIKSFRSDNGTEYINTRFNEAFKEWGIERENTQVDTPQQNGVSEQLNRTIKEGARTLLSDAKLPTRYWPQAVKFFVYVKNRRPHAKLNFKTPFELWNGSEPAFKHIKPFGTHGVARDKNAATNPTFEETGIPCRLLCISITKKGYILLNTRTGELFESRDVRFLNHSPDGDEGVRAEEDLDYDMLFADDPQSIEFQKTTRPRRSADSEDESNHHHDDHQNIHAQNVNTEQNSTQNSSLPTTVQQIQPKPNPCEHVDQQQVSQRNLQLHYFTQRQLEEYMHQNSDATVRALPGAPLTIPNPSGRPSRAKRYQVCYVNPIQEVKSALNGPEGVEWSKAMDEEFQSLIDNQTWILTAAPPQAKIIKTKRILKKKTEDDGSTRYKARLVAMGHTQKFGIDYHETRSPVIRHSSIRILLAHAAQHQIHIHHVDVKTAYLNGELSEELYIEQPFNYVKQGHEHLVCRLKRSIYGLKQAALCWNRKLDAILNQLHLHK